MSDLQLLETLHPDKNARAVFDSLIGIDDHKQRLLDELVALLAPGRMERWLKRHHKNGLALTERWTRSVPLVLLSGDVGCGKTALAGSVGTPLAKEVDRRIATLETPSDLRGWGHVGELSARITSAFDQAKRRSRDVGGGLLIIDEADDVATARAQNQAHHEDRAGLNVLIKQIDQVARSKDPLVVVLITNRHTVLDPAVRRRTALHLAFNRPDAPTRHHVFEQLLQGVALTQENLKQLVQRSENTIPYSYSDLVDRLARAVLREAIRRNQPVSVCLVLEGLATWKPSPLLRESVEG